MKAQRFLRILSVLLLMSLSLAAVSPAYADGPIQYKIPLDYSFTLKAGVDSPCNFDVDWHMSGHLLDQLWYDNNGNLTKETILYADKVTLSAYGNKVLAQESGRGVIVPKSETERLIIVSGHDVSYTVPGYGFFGGVGHWSATQFLNEEGWWEVDEVFYMVGKFTDWDFGIVCEYLGS